MGLTQSTPPTAEPVTLGELKTALQVGHSADDAPLTVILGTSRAWVENESRRQLMSATYTLTLDYFPCEIELPRSPVQSVTSITYLDSNGTSQTLATTVYAVDTACEPPMVRLKYGQVWPTTYGIENAVTIVFVAGYSTAALVPPETKQAIICFARQQYDPEFVGAQNKDSAWSRATMALARMNDNGQFY